MSEQEPLYRVTFYQAGKVYEIYSRYLSDESLMGFVELEEIVFKEIEGGVVVDPGEERLRQEFKGVNRIYIPVHLLLRIDEVKKEGPARIREDKGEGAAMGSNVISPFPGSFQWTKRDND